MAHQLGVSCLRVACLSGRRYEDFHEMAMKEFVAHWQKTEKAEPLLKNTLLGRRRKSQGLAGGRTAAMPKRIGSEYIWACAWISRQQRGAARRFAGGRREARRAIRRTHPRKDIRASADEGFRT